MGVEGRPVAQALDLAECQPARRVGVGETGQKEPAEQAGEHPHRQQEAGSTGHPPRAIERYSAARHDHVDMRMVGHCRAPAMKHGGGADAGPEVSGIGGTVSSVSAAVRNSKVIDHRLVLHDRGDLGREGEDQVEVTDRQQIGLARGKKSCAAAPWHWGNGGCGTSCKRSGCGRNLSQRSTCLPRAAERQLSTADITWSWPRLRCPALARRQPAP